MYELELVGPEGQVRHIHYEPHFNEMYWDDGEKFQVNQFRFAQDMNWEAATIVSPDMPGKKSRDAKVIKIQLGLKCNYACSYCNQAAQPHDYDGSPKEVDAFFDKFQTWFNLGDGEGKRIEFWGGEPFVYWKTLKPLAEKVRAAYPKAEFNIITNASLFDKDKVDWLVSLGFQVGISHDGPGYEENRGQDPLKDKDILPWVKYAYDQLHPSGKIGFNCVLTGRHYSIKEVKEYIGHHLGVAPEDVPVTTEEILLAYDDNAVSVGLQDEMDAAMLMHTVFYEGITGVAMPSLAGKIKDFLTSVTNQAQLCLGTEVRDGSPRQRGRRHGRQCLDMPEHQQRDPPQVGKYGRLGRRVSQYCSSLVNPQGVPAVPSLTAVPGGVHVP